MGIPAIGPVVERARRAGKAALARWQSFRFNATAVDSTGAPFAGGVALAQLDTFRRHFELQAAVLGTEGTVAEWELVARAAKILTPTPLVPTLQRLRAGERHHPGQRGGEGGQARIGHACTLVGTARRGKVEPPVATLRVSPVHPPELIQELVNGEAVVEVPLNDSLTSFSLVAIADAAKLKKQADDEQKQAQDWEQRAMLAVRQERDDLARLRGRDRRAHVQGAPHRRPVVRRAHAHGRGVRCPELRMRRLELS